MMVDILTFVPQEPRDASFIVSARCKVDDGEVYSAEFDIWQVTNWSGDNSAMPGLHCFERGKEEGALPLISGFCKWDGCMQFGPDAAPYQFHLDSPVSIRHLGDALLVARAMCRKLIGDTWMETAEETVSFVVVDGYDITAHGGAPRPP